MDSSPIIVFGARAIERITGALGFGEGKADCRNAVIALRLPAFDPRELNDAARAKREARMIASKHAGVIAWQRTADPSIGEYGPPEVLFQRGKIPDME